MRRYVPQNTTCQKCGESLHWNTTSDYCGKPECRKLAEALAKARWEGHLLRNNVDPYK